MGHINDMTEGRPSLLILRFALPLMLGNLLLQAYSLVDAAIVGRLLGIGPLAAIGASSSVLFLILGFCNGCSAGFCIPVAQRFGARDYSGMRHYVSTSLRIAAWLSIALAIVTCLLCRHILEWMQTPDDIMADAWAYLFVTFAGLPTLFYFYLISGILRALGDSKAPFWFLAFGAALNVVLDLLFIRVLGGGVVWAAVASVVSQTVSAVWAYAYMRRAYPVLRYVGVEETVFRWATGRRVLSIGVPMGLQFSITAIGSMMLQASNNALGTTCMAAFTTAMRIKMFLMCMLENMGVAMATYCGQNFGAGERRRIVIGVRDAWFIVVGYSLAVLVIVWPVTYEMGALFVSEAEGADTAGVLRGIEQFLHSSIPFYPVLGTLCVLRYSIQGMGHTKLAMLSGVSEMIARTAVSLWAVPVWGYTAVCFGDPTAWLAAVGFLVPAFWFTLRRSFPRQSLPHTRRIPVAASE